MIASDASTLIIFAKVGRLNLLIDLFGRITIEEKVKEEIVDGGLEEGYPDAILLNEYILRKKIIVKKARIRPFFRGLQEGESNTIQLSKDLKIKEILMDEEDGRQVAKLSGLKPRGTLFVLLEAVRRGKITKKQAREIFSEMLRKGFWLSSAYSAAFLEKLETI